MELSKKGSELAESDRLEFYRENFEKKFLETAERFYKQNTSQVMEEGGVRAYMVYADKKLTEEEHRGRKYLNTSTKESLDKVAPLLFNYFVCLIRLRQTSTDFSFYF